MESISLEIFHFVAFDLQVWWCPEITSDPHSPRSPQLATCKEKESDLAEGTGVVSTKYPPTIKLELFSTLEC